MSDIIETVAKAIYESRNGAGAVPWSRRDWARKQPYLNDAKVAIKALQEPTEAMLEAGEAADRQAHEWCERELGETITGDVQGAWSAMIDAALK